MVDFSWNTDLYFKTKVIGMIDELNVNHKVGIVWIRL